MGDYSSGIDDYFCGWIGVAGGCHVAASAAGVGWKACAAACGPAVTGAFRFMRQGEPGTIELCAAPAPEWVGDVRAVALGDIPPGRVVISLTLGEWAVVLEGLAAHGDHYSRAPDAVQPSAVAVLIELQLRGMD